MDSLAATDKIIAAGAVVTRQGPTGTEYLLVHRGYRQDWTFPKGKVDPGEHVLAAAVREVREETGFAIRLGIQLPTQTYKVEGRLKDSHYWLGELLAGEFLANDEVDEIAWLTFDQAAKRLTYEHDHDVLTAASAVKPTSPLIILRHTQSVKRAEWLLSSEGLAEVDASRPLTAVGRMQANSLVGALAAFGIDEIHSSDSRRCRDTVGPFATARSLAVTLERTVSEERHQEHPEKARSRVAELARQSKPLVLCTHRPVMPTVMESLAEVFELEAEFKKAFDPALTPGSMVLFHRDAANLSKVVSVERHMH